MNPPFTSEGNPSDRGETSDARVDVLIGGPANGFIEYSAEGCLVRLRFL